MAESDLFVSRPNGGLLLGFSSERERCYGLYSPYGKLGLKSELSLESVVLALVLCQYVATSWTERGFCAERPIL